jgi:hypothetical protein
MAEANLICLFGESVKTMKHPTLYCAKSLTWEGHEFLEASRNENVWNKVKAIIKDKGLGLIFEVIKGLLLEESLKRVGLK